jgi:hypothetical protein
LTEKKLFLIQVNKIYPKQLSISAIAERVSVLYRGGYSRLMRFLEISYTALSLVEDKAAVSNCQRASRKSACAAGVLRLLWPKILIQILRPKPQTEKAIKKNKKKINKANST